MHTHLRWQPLTWRRLRRNLHLYALVPCTLCVWCVARPVGPPLHLGARAETAVVLQPVC